VGTKREQAERERNAARMKKMLDRLEPLDRWVARSPRTEAQIEDYDRLYTAVAKYAKEGYVSTARIKVERSATPKKSSNQKTSTTKTSAARKRKQTRSHDS